MQDKNIVKGIATAVKEGLSEAISPSAVVLIQGKEVPFGDKLHQAELASTLECLEKLRNCYPKGSAARQTYSHACSRLRKLLASMTPKQTQVAV